MLNGERVEAVEGLSQSGEKISMRVKPLEMIVALGFLNSSMLDDSDEELADMPDVEE